MRNIIYTVAVSFLFIACQKQEVVDQAKIDEDIINEYIADNSIEDVQSTPSGLHYVIKNEGLGERPNASSTVLIYYKGYLTDGTVFDESPSEGLDFPLNSLIEGWQEGIPLFKEGGKGTLIIPSGLGYGSQRAGDIPPNSVLIFDIELIDVW